MKKVIEINKNVKKSIFRLLLIFIIIVICLIFYRDSKIIITETNREITKLPKEIQTAEDDLFKIILKDDRDYAISNAKFIIKEVIFAEEQKSYSNPTDEEGNVQYVKSFISCDIT